QLEVAEVHPGDAGSVDHGNVSGVDRDLHPTGPACFADTVDSRDQIRKSVVAVGIGDRAQVSAAVDGVQHDGPVRQARLAWIVYAVAIGVLKLLTGDRPREVRVKRPGSRRCEGLEEIAGPLLQSATVVV